MALIAALTTCVWGCLAQAEEMPNSFVRLRDVAPFISQDIRYASRFNFTGAPAPGYESAACILTAAAAEALVKVERNLNRRGFGLKVFDCYRPEKAVRYFSSWIGGAENSGLKSIFYPNLDRGKLGRLGYIAAKSGHSRGSTVDVGLVKLSDAALATPVDAGACDGPLASRPRESSLDMGSSFDCFSPNSWTSSKGVSAEARANRNRLQSAMTQFGFRGYDREWWHFTLIGEPYPDTYFDFPVK